MKTEATVDEKGTEQRSVAEQTEQKPAAQAEPQKPAKPVKQKPPVVPKEVIDKHKSFDQKVDEEEYGKQTAKKPAGETEEAASETNITGDEPVKPEAKAEEAAGKEKSAEAKPKLSPELLTRAAQAGLTLAKVLEFETPEDLENALAIFEAKPIKPDADDAGKKGKEGEGQTEKFDCGLNPEEYDDGIIKTFNTMGQKILDRVNALEKELKETKGSSSKASNDAAVHTHTVWLDSKFSALGAEAEAVFGKGSFGEIKPDSEAFKNRKAISEEVIAIAAGYKATGKTKPSNDVIFARAINNLFGDKIKQAKDNGAVDKSKKRAQQALGPGSQAAGSEEAAALKVQHEFDSKIDED